MVCGRQEDDLFKHRKSKGWRWTERPDGRWGSRSFFFAIFMILDKYKEWSVEYEKDSGLFPNRKDYCFDFFLEVFTAKGEMPKREN